MFPELLYEINLWVLFPILALTYLFSIIVGFRIGKQTILKERKEFFISILQISILSLVILLVIFTFAMAAIRHETRKTLIQEESSAIYTVSLRAKLLPKANQQDIQELLRLYYKLRSEDLSSKYDAAKLKRIEKSTQKLQLIIWNQVVEIAKTHPEDNTFALLLESVNHMIALYSKREMEMANHIPAIIFFLLFFTSVASLLLAGYSLGQERSNQFLPISILAILLLVMTIVIIDLDGPRGGLIKVSLSNIANIRDLTIQVPD